MRKGLIFKKGIIIALAAAVVMSRRLQRKKYPNIY